MGRFLILTFVLLAAFSASASGSSGWNKKEVLAALKRAVKGTARVSEVFAPLTEDRIPVLFIVRGKVCVDSAGPAPTKECSATSEAHVAILSRGTDGQLGVDSELELPTAGSGWGSEDLLWGLTEIKDYDADGRPELLAVYAYDGPNYPAVGSTHYKQLVIINLSKPLSVALDLVLAVHPQAMSTEQIDAKWSFAKGSGAPDVILKRSTGVLPDHADTRKFTEQIVRYRYDASTDSWRVLNPPKTVNPPTRN